MCFLVAKRLLRRFITDEPGTTIGVCCRAHSSASRNMKQSREAISYMAKRTGDRIAGNRIILSLDDGRPHRG
jgi:hypothetical protein